MADLTLSLQENLLTVLTYSDSYGKLIAQIIDPELFEGDYFTVASAAIDFWNKHGEAPKGHIADLLAPVLEDKDDKRAGTFRRILLSMGQLSDGINEKFVYQEIQKFVRLQKLKGAIFDAASALQQPGEGTITQVEEVLADILSARDITFEPGSKLSDVDSMMDYLETRDVEFVTGIPELDRSGVVPARGEMFVLLAPARRGKSWFVMNLVKHNLIRRKRALHVSLEMSEEQCKQRYWQMLHAIPKREATVEIPTIETDDRGRIVSMGHVSETRPLTLRSPNLRSELLKRVAQHGPLMDRLVIKRFPSHQLNVNALCGYIDGLMLREGFTPDIVVLDYPQLMKMDPKNLRIELGRTVMELRSRLAVERNCALVIVHQTGRDSDEARQTKASHISEDWSVVQTADNIVTYSATKAERRFGLARLYVEKARGDAGDFGVLITQRYEIGQFALQSYYLPGNYFDELEAIKKSQGDEDGDDDNE